MHTRSYLLITMILCTYLSANQADHERAHSIHEPTISDIAKITASIKATGYPIPFTDEHIRTYWQKIKDQAIALTEPKKMFGNWSFAQAFNYASKESILHAALSNDDKTDTDPVYAATALYLAKQYNVPIESAIVILPFKEQTQKIDKTEKRAITNKNAWDLSLNS